MRIFQACARLCIAVAAVISVQTFGQTSTNLTGQWDFNQGDLKATVGTDMQFLRDTATKTTFQTIDVNGANGNVMDFPAATASEGYLVFHGAKPNGGGTNVNIYTLVLDLLWPSATSDGTFRALYNSDTNNAQDAIMFVNPDNAIGINNDYAGEMLADTWYRLALVVNLNETNSTITKFLNGVNVGVQTLDANSVDSRFSLGPAFLLFTDASEETAPGLVDRVQFYSDALGDTQVAALGLPLGDGAPPVGGDLKIDSIQKVGNNVVITASGGGNLQLVRKDKLTDTDWQPVGQPTTSGTFTTAASGATGFFRVKR
jgi:hypothetical protein